MCSGHWNHKTKNVVKRNNFHPSWPIVTHFFNFLKWNKRVSVLRVGSLFNVSNGVDLINFVLALIWDIFFFLKILVMYWTILPLLKKFSKKICCTCYYTCYLNYNTNRNNIVRKFLAICATHLTGGLLSKMVKYFEAMLKVFEFFPPVRNLDWFM